MKKERGIVIWLGKVLRKNGLPEPMLLNRCHKALEIAKMKKFPIIVTGGDTINCGITEATVMADFIRQFDAEVEVLVEHRADNTVENFQNCLAMVSQSGVEEVALVTCEHHMPRAEFVCRAVMISRGIDLVISCHPAPDMAGNVTQLRQEEYRKIFSTPEYLQRKFNIAPPGDLHFQKAKKDLETLLATHKPRRKSCAHIKVDKVILDRVDCLQS